MKRYQLFINNEWIDPAGGEWFDSTEPYSGQVWSQIPGGNSANVDKAVEAAHAAFHRPSWSELTATQCGAAR